MILFSFEMTLNQAPQVQPLHFPVACEHSPESDKHLHSATRDCINRLMVPDDESYEVNKEWRRTFVSLATTCLSSEQTSSPAMWYVRSPSFFLQWTCLLLH
jgi:hypothetical protein